MGRRGWELVHEKYHYSRLVHDMNNLYTGLLSLTFLQETTIN